MVLYRFTCANCNIGYIGKTKRHFEVRTNEHLGISSVTGKPYTYNPNTATAVRKHLHQCGYHASINDFKIIGSARVDKLLYIKEGLLIRHDRPILNRNVQSSPIYLYD